jgi:hypothetical protein
MVQSLVLINGGAIIALLTFLGNPRSVVVFGTDPAARLADTFTMFATGLGLSVGAGLGFFIANELLGRADEAIRRSLFSKYIDGKVIAVSKPNYTFWGMFSDALASILLISSTVSFVLAAYVALQAAQQ